MRSWPTYPLDRNQHSFPDSQQKTAWGYTVALALAAKYGTEEGYNKANSKLGRGSAFYAALDAIRAAGN